MRMFAALVALATLAAALWLWAPWESIDRPADEIPAAEQDERGAAVGPAATGGLPPAESPAARTDVALETGTARVTGGEAGTISGRIVDAENLPIADARVVRTGRTGWFRPDWLADPTQALSFLGDAAETAVETRTGRDGRFRLPVSEADSPSSILAVALGFAAKKVDVPGTAGGPIEIGDVALTQGVIVHGRVLDPSGSALANAVVRHRKSSGDLFISIAGDNGPGIGGVRTDEGGEFRVLVDEVGEFTLEANHSDFASASASAVANARGDIVRDLVIRLGVAGEIAGAVTGLPTTSSDAAFEIRARKLPKTTAIPDSEPFATSLGYATTRSDIAADGTFRLRGLELDREYELAAFESTSDQPWRARQVTTPTRARTGNLTVRLRYDRGIYATFRAVDAETGQPLDLVTVDRRMSDEDRVVHLINRGKGEAIAAGEDGVFRVGPLRTNAGDLRITLLVQAKGYSDWQQDDIRLPASGDLDLGSIRLTPAPIVRVRVLTPNGDPVPGARVAFRPRVERTATADGTVQRESVMIHSTAGDLELPDLDIPAFGLAQDSRRGETDADGICELTVDPGQVGRLRVRHRDHARFVGDEFTAPMRGTLAREVKLVRGGKIVARVVDADGQPVAGIRVHCRPLDGGQLLREETDVEGVARFSKLNSGEFGLSLSDAASGFMGAVVMHSVSFGNDSSEDGTGRLRSGEEAASLRGEETVEITLVQPAKSRLVGTVTVDGRPLDGASVSVKRRSSTPDDRPGFDSVDFEIEGLPGFGSAKRARTDALGRFEIDRVDVGEISLIVRHRDRAMRSTFDFTAVAGTTQCDMTLSMTRISGRVVDQQGQPVVGARVSVERAPRASARGANRVVVSDVTFEALGGGLAGSIGGDEIERTNSQGEFEIEGVEPGVPLVLKVVSRDFADATSEPLELSTGEQRADVVIAVQRGGAIDIDVANHETGEDLLFVSAHPIDDPTAQKTEMIRGGHGKLRGLAPGVWNVTLSTGSAGGETKSVEVLAGRTASAQFSL